MQPLPTHALSAKQVVQFRDEAFHAYFSSDRYLDMVESRFGRPVRDHVVDISKNKLRRRLLET